MLNARMLCRCCVAAVFGLAGIAGAKAQRPVGLFSDHQDVGAVLHPGSVRFDAAAGSYAITGSGENMWFGKDEFHFVWKKVSGDVRLAAEIRFEGTGGNKHRKAVLMMRQSLETGSAAVDVALHGDGLTSLQFRDASGETTHEVEAAVTAPSRVELVKRGDRFYASVRGADGGMHPSGASIKVPLTGEFYVGLGVSAHDKDVSETAVFSKVELAPVPPVTGKPVLWSVLETVNVASTDRRVAYLAPTHFEAPNWSRDGSFLLVNRSEGGTGHIVRLGWEQQNLLATTPTVVTTGAQTHVNNDHGLSPDGTQLAISDGSSPDGNSRVYVLPVTGGTPREVTPTGPSYWHGWSPDGKTLAFVGERGGEFDIYTVAAGGGAQTRLTTAKGLDDGPEYSPDGRWIYFNSVRAPGGTTGKMQIWRMHPDGSSQEQVLDEATNDWFPHLSPDGKLMAFVAYAANVEGHPAGQDVELRVMSLADKKVRTVAKLFGGQGTMNVASWAPDSSRLAFVSYELLPATETAAP